MNTKFVPSLSHPCSQDWNDMSGDDKRRFCDRCQLHVHNLSAMSPIEQRTLLSERGVRRCVAYLTTSNSIRVRSGTWLFLQRWLRPWRAAVAVLTILLPSAFSGCATSRPQTLPQPADTHDSKQVRQIHDGKMVAGGITCEPPLWRRILFFWER